MSELLHTLAAACRQAGEIRKSRFLVHAAPVDSPEAALAYLRAVRDASASHNCWAWRLGANYRFNDDGEPGGSAGRPILLAIDGQRMDRVMVVVSRWFGGIKLGVGGLMRAYGGSAAECLRCAERVPLMAMARLRVRCAFAELARLRAHLREAQAEIECEVFDGDGVQLQLRLPESLAAPMQAWISDLTRGRSEAMRLDGLD